MSVKDDLIAQIDNGSITFDPPAATSARLKSELLGENTGTHVTTLLQELVLAVSKITSIRISSIIRNESLHGLGRAFDVGNEAVADELLEEIANDAKVAELKIDEIIFDAAVADPDNDRNKWNYDKGVKHNYDAETLDDHKNHIHFAVKNG